ncbi:unnamed protein product [Orchesella dallaii]|uniref:Uncharacterized protein n=1 Tax=Orchesella dallaii TaxID=48710 RepID=A0ABP1QIM6_9HEXA
MQHPPHWKRKHVENSRSNSLRSIYQKKEEQIPAKLRKFYESTYPIPSLDERSRSVFLQPPNDILEIPPLMKRAAPTPVYLKKQLYPLPAALTSMPLAMASGTEATNNNSTPGPRSRYSMKGKVEKDSLYSVPPVTSTKVNFHKQTRGGGGSLPGLPSQKISTTRTTSKKTAAATNYKSLPKVPLSQSRIPQQKPSFAGGYSTPAPDHDAGGAGIGSSSTFESWTLKVSKFDIMKLRHELDGESVKERMAKFEEKFLRPSSA